MKKNFFFSFCMIIPLLSVLVASISCSKDDITGMQTSPLNPTDTVLVPVTDSASADTASASFLALGDSYTIGQSVHAKERFPAQTVELLKQDSVAIKDPQYIATTGWTTTNLMAAINSQVLPHNYNVVTLLIGVNDQYQRHDTTGYGARFTALLDKAIMLAGNRKEHVFVLSIPDYSATPFVPAQNKPFVKMQINAFNSINKQITKNYNVEYINITPSTRKAATDSTLIAFDDLHPSGKEYKVWAEMLVPLIKKVLK